MLEMIRDIDFIAAYYQPDAVFEHAIYRAGISALAQQPWPEPSLLTLVLRHLGGPGSG